MKQLRLVFSAAALACLALPAFASDGDARVIVGFKGAADASVLTARGGEVEDVIESGRAAVVTIAPSRIASLRACAAVSYVEEDGIVEATDGKAADDHSSKGPGGVGPAAKSSKGGPSSSPPPQTTGWGVARVWGQSDAPATGAGVKIAIIDTGLSLNHQDLKANIHGGINLVRTGKNPEDDNGHGSHCGGIAAAVDNSIGYVGVAPGAWLYAVKVLDARGSGWLSTVASGIDWARTSGMKVASMSLGASSGATALENACDSAAAAGVLLVAAAGNGGDGNTATEEKSWPAMYDSVVSVGATGGTSGGNDLLAWFTNSSPKVEISAPGVAIPSTYKSGGYATLSGTSMSTPHVAGLAALLLGNGSTAATLRADLDACVLDLGPGGRDSGYGFGLAYWPRHN